VKVIEFTEQTLDEEEKLEESDFLGKTNLMDD